MLKFPSHHKRVGLSLAILHVSQQTSEALPNQTATGLSPQLGGNTMSQEPGRSCNQAILSAWQEQLTKAQSPILNQQYLFREPELLARFAENRVKLNTLPRRIRRDLQQLCKQSLPASALLLALSAPNAALALPPLGDVGRVIAAPVTVSAKAIVRGGQAVLEGGSQALQDITAAGASLLPCYLEV
jgi:hypothetical protein